MAVDAPASEQSSTYTAPRIDEDELYEQAFNELEGEKRVVAAWSRAFSEAEGDEQKAKALYISARVASLKQEILSRHYLEAEQLEAERLVKDKAEAERKAEEEAALAYRENKPPDLRFVVGIVIILSVAGLIIFLDDTFEADAPTTISDAPTADPLIKPFAFMSNAGVCLAALKLPNEPIWSDDRSYVEEAQRRGLSARDCTLLNR